MGKIKKLITTFLTMIKKRKKFAAVLAVVLALLVYFGSSQFTKTQAPTYQTTKVERGTLVSAITESGQVAVANRTSITTQASGSVSGVYVKNGDTVIQGQKIADVTLDMVGQQRQAQAWSSYLSAKNTLASAQNKLNSLQSTMFKANQSFVNDKGVFNPSDTQKSDPKYIEENADWLASEADYKNQSAVIIQSQAALNSSWLAYQAASSIITAPVAGIVSDLILIEGMQVGSANTTASTNTGASSQVIGAIKTPGSPVVAVSLSEIDAVKVKEGNKVTVAFDALPNKTFTGKVAGINTNGIVNSGVTTYPTTILLDVSNDQILPNMSATANIVTSVKNDVMLVPSSAIQTANGQTMVRVLKNSKISQISVEIGESSDTETEIISGLTEGEDVVVGVQQTSSQSGATSPFSTVRFGGLGGGGRR